MRPWVFAALIAISLAAKLASPAAEVCAQSSVTATASADKSVVEAGGTVELIGSTSASLSDLLIADDAGDELWLIDRTTPSSSTLIGSFPSGLTSPRGMTVFNGELLVADDAGDELWLIDRTTPSSSTLIGSFPSGLTDVRGLAVFGSDLLIFETAGDAWIANRSTPGSSTSISISLDGSSIGAVAGNVVEVLVADSDDDDLAAMWWSYGYSQWSYAGIGSFPNGLTDPSAMTVAGDELLIADNAGDELWLGDDQTASASTLIGAFPSGLTTPRGMASLPKSVTYNWTSDAGGTFADSTATSTSWTAPEGHSRNIVATLTLTVSGSGFTAMTATVTVTVEADNPLPASFVEIPLSSAALMEQDKNDTSTYVTVDTALFFACASVVECLRAPRSVFSLQPLTADYRLDVEFAPIKSGTVGVAGIIEMDYVTPAHTGWSASATLDYLRHGTSTATIAPSTQVSLEGGTQGTQRVTFDLEQKAESISTSTPRVYQARLTLTYSDFTTNEGKLLSISRLFFGLDCPDCDISDGVPAVQSQLSPSLPRAVPDTTDPSVSDAIAITTVGEMAAFDWPGADVVRAVAESSGVEARLVFAVGGFAALVWIFLLVLKWAQSLLIASVVVAIGMVVLGIPTIGMTSTGLIVLFGLIVGAVLMVTKPGVT